ncbi:hypothetical protein ARMSODRAFT_1061454 [Armillaria solidipes]|uniref:Uncharacterized protein n=1 Tax=Armillaria solidipes TaxID=1076256 RepID=A0A2H3B8V5_9AGAR|nr:hypothetical protein ARMSODRAFT_1061454 [Armillaria solidipes]
MTGRQHLGTPTPELTDSEIKEIYVALDTEFNGVVLTASLYVSQFFEGIYTGVVAVTLWAVASRKNCQNDRRSHFLVVIILLLYLLSGFNLYTEWAEGILNFITNGESFWVAYTFICRGIVAYYAAVGPNVPPPAIFLENVVRWSVLYSSLVLVTLLWCTILIIYRIWKVGGAAGRIRVYQRVIEMLVESASLYSAVIVVLLVFEARNEVAGIYIEGLAVAMRGIMPTMLVGRVAAGHARPDDSWSESTPRSSLRFGNQSSSQNDSQRSVGSGQVTSSRVRPDLEEGLESIERKISKLGKNPNASSNDHSPIISCRWMTDQVKAYTHQFCNEGGSTRTEKSTLIESSPTSWIVRAEHLDDVLGGVPDALEHAYPLSGW